MHDPLANITSLLLGTLIFVALQIAVVIVRMSVTSGMYQNCHSFTVIPPGLKNSFFQSTPKCHTLIHFHTNE